MKLLSILCLSVVLASSLATTPHQECPKGGPYDIKVSAMDVPGCDAPPCQIKKGTNVSVSITFSSANKSYPKLENKVYGIIGGVPVPFPGYPSNMVDVCSLGVTCPTKAGTPATEKVTLPVIPAAPDISLTAQFKLSDGTNIVGCEEVPLKIVS